MRMIAPLLRAALGRRLPAVDGRISVRGPRQPVSLRRDRYGIVYVDARGEEDAWFGLGFAQAQDRAFQLELRLRTLRGTLSALFGEQTLSIDRLARRIGFVEAGRRMLEVLHADVRAEIEAFARGINAGLDACVRAVAPEFALLRSRPSAWRAEDVVAMGKLLSFMLIGNWDVELTRLKVLLEDGPQALRDLDPTPYPPDHVVVSPAAARAGPVADALGRDLEAFLRFTGRSTGSNAWALSGKKTASGQPILANDPHLEAALPGHWYLASLRTPEWQVAGASMIGLPGFGAGHNGRVAWGVTASLVDTCDLFIEEPGPDGRSVRRGDGYEPCTVRREVIEVRGRSPAIEDVLVTPRGPVISPALEGGLPALSLRAVWLDAKPARGFTRMHTVRSFEEMQKEFEQWPLLSQNLVYADTAGNVGWQLVGEAPRRRREHAVIPASAADEEAGWLEERVAAAEMPYVLNPPAGFVATANNQPVPEGQSPYLGSDWLDGYRAGRITEALEARHDWDVPSTMALQMDLVSLPWRELRDIIIVLDGPDAGGEAIDPKAVQALALLREWDGQMGVDSAGAAVFVLFLREMGHRMAGARAPHSADWAVGRGFTPLMPGSTFTGGRASRAVRRLIEQPEGWFARGWCTEMLDALATVVAGLQGQRGPDAAAWGWGHVRPLTLVHPLGIVKALAPVLNRGPFPWGGDGNTVSQAAGADPMVVASLRAVIPVGDWESARYVLPGGQSGNPFSPHYDDMLPLWKQGEGVPIAWGEDAVDAATVSRLRVLPLGVG